MPLRNKKEILSWCLFDFANSSYSAVIAAVLFPVFYATQIVGNETGQGDLWWGRAISLSMAIIAASSPFIGGIADYSGIRKRLLFFYTFLSIIMVASFSVLERGMVIEGFVVIVLANIGMEGGLVFYNSFLPEIAEKSHQGRVSAWGFALGYCGSIASLLIALPLVKSGAFGAAWIMTALFFALFAMPAFFFLPKDRRNSERAVHSAVRGMRYTWSTLRDLWSRKNTRRFLIAYLVYEDGVNTVIIFSSIFAATTLQFLPKDLVLLYLLVQVTAFAGAFIFARTIDVRGPKEVVMASLVLWTVVSVAAFFIKEKVHFIVLSCLAGLGLGTVQAATRALFAQLIPQGLESEYFGVYSMVGKSSAVLGPLVFGSLSVYFGSQRPAILSVALFFFTGLLILSSVKGGGPNIRDAS